MTAAELASVQQELVALEAELARRANLKIAGYFHECDPGCQPHSFDPADHVPRVGRTRPTCRVLYQKHGAFFRAGARFRQRMILAGNRTGKTDSAAYECTLHLTGGLKGKALVGAENALYDIALSSRVDIRAMLSAVGILLERGYGKPPQAIELTTGESDLTTLSTDELAMRAAALLERVRSSQPKTPAAAPSQPS